MSITFSATGCQTELNVANGNAAIIMKAAGIPSASMWDTPSIHIEQIRHAANAISEGVDFIRPKIVDGNVTHWGCNIDQLRRYSATLLALVDEAERAEVLWINVS